jgi:hypothetical protein
VIRTALLTLSSIAAFEGERRRLFVRVARIENTIWYDLCDGRAVRIDGFGWEIIDVPPALFRRYGHQRPQVEPRRRGDLRDLLKFIQLRSRSQETLLLAYAVCALVQGIPRPVVIFHGEHGSGKSTSQHILRELIDPSIVAQQPAPKDVSEFIQAASHTLCLYLDNVSHLPDWLSDALCRLCTGDGFSKRQLYTDDDDVIYSLRGLAGLNGINLVATRADLLDRALLFELQAIAETERRTEEELWAAFAAAKPYLVGALFDALSAAIRTLDGIRPARLPRMADFARWGCAVARHLGFGQDEFLGALGANITAQNETAVENSPVALAVIQLVQDVACWEDTPARTLIRLNQIAVDLQIDTRSRAWPKAPGHLTRRLNEVKPNLQRLGISVLYRRTGNHRLITIAGDVTTVTEPEETVTRDDSGVTDETTGARFADSAGLDAAASDDSDDTLTTSAGVGEWVVP